MENTKVETLLYSTQEAASAIGCCNVTVYKLMSQGKLRAVKLGKRTLIPADNLRSFIADLPAATINLPSRRKTVTSAAA